MILDIIVLIVSLAAVVFGAELLVNGSSDVARRFGMSEFVIGFMIIGFGTSCPELVVSVTGAIEGNSDVSIGNVIGSNIFNTLLILGLSSMFFPISINETNRRKDIPIALLVTFLLCFIGFKGTFFNLGSDGISRAAGILFIVLFLAYSLVSIFAGRKTEENAKETYKANLFKASVLIVAGLAGLIFGGKFFVDSAVRIAGELGISDKFIAITILAGGTSLPELVTCLVACAKKKDQMALGDILGSNVFNILLILGTSATIHPISLNGIDMIDILLLITSAILPWIWAYTGKKNRIDRWEGFIMLCVFIGYYVSLFQKL